MGAGTTLPVAEVANSRSVLWWSCGKEIELVENIVDAVGSEGDSTPDTPGSPKMPVEIVVTSPPVMLRSPHPTLLPR
jgi:hypothetical protein